MEEDFVVEVQVEVFTVGLFNYELSEERIYKEELDLGLGKNEVSARIR